MPKIPFLLKDEILNDPDTYDADDTGAATLPELSGLSDSQTTEPLVASPQYQDLQSYLLSRANADKQDLLDAQKTAGENRSYARIAQAAANLGAGLAGPQALNQSPFESLASDSEQPVKDLEKRQALQGGTDKVLSSYLLGQARQKQAQASLDQRTQHQGNMEKLSGDKNEILKNFFTGKNQIAAKGVELSSKRLGLQTEGLDLRRGAQAAQAAGHYVNDPVMKQSSTQLAQLEKDLGRLDDIDSGKVKFSTSLNNELQSGLANAISGGTNAALGKLERIEFEPYVAKWQAMKDRLLGYQGDINAPEYKAQLRANIEGLKHDLLAIQANRKAFLKKTYGTAYSKNPLAARVIEENSAPEAKQVAPIRSGALTPEQEARLKELEAKAKK